MCLVKNAVWNDYNVPYNRRVEKKLQSEEATGLAVEQIRESLFAPMLRLAQVATAVALVSVLGIGDIRRRHQEKLAQIQRDEQEGRITESEAKEARRNENTVAAVEREREKRQTRDSN